MYSQSIRDRIYAAVASMALSMAMIAVTVAPTAPAASPINAQIVA